MIVRMVIHHDKSLSTPHPASLPPLRPLAASVECMLQRTTINSSQAGGTAVTVLIIFRASRDSARATIARCNSYSPYTIASYPPPLPLHLMFILNTYDCS